MNFKNIFISFAAMMLLLINAFPCEAQNSNLTTKSSSSATIEVIQFHSEHRCMTCNKIEALSRETLKRYPTIAFLLVNVDDAKNERKAAQFEATGTALFLYNPKTGRKKDLTDFAFMNAGNRDKFIEGLKREIHLFLKS